MQEMWEIQEIWVPFLGQEDALEEKMATHSSGLPGRKQSKVSQKVGHDWVTEHACMLYMKKKKKKEQNIHFLHYTIIFFRWEIW